jgi:glutamyl-Q tRNA(Asp) synthetase
VKSSTATGTTATAENGGRSPSGRYRGRFAPSPTGLLHSGSLLAAVASWLDARAQDGVWLVRMEDLDTPRNRPGADTAILGTLRQLGLTADEPVQWQSHRPADHHAALAKLRQQGRLYRCVCSRSETAHPYPGTCRDAGHNPNAPGALRFRMDPGLQAFEDRIQGRVEFDAAELGDPVLLRRDGIVAYQLAVVVDDLAQGITDVVRGADLLDSTPWQMQIASALGGFPPRYAHVPLLLESDGQKLSKSRHSVPLDLRSAGATLHEALRLLGQEPPSTLAAASPHEVLAWGVTNWQPARLAGQRTRIFDA